MTRRMWLVVVALLALPAPASAFHAGNLFDKPAGAGGGGRLFYTGSARERGWTCTACHLSPPRQLRVSVSSEPPELLRDGVYTPGQAYVLSVIMDQDRLGTASSLSNFNGMAMTLHGPDKAAVGSLSGFAAEDFVTGNESIIASAGRTTGETSWSFTWTAPSEPVVVNVHLGVVDGNGANSDATQTLTDPFGDDVFVGAALFRPQGGSTPNNWPLDLSRADETEPLLDAPSEAPPAPLPRQRAIPRASRPEKPASPAQRESPSYPWLFPLLAFGLIGSGALWRLRR